MTDQLTTLRAAAEAIYTARMYVRHPGYDWDQDDEKDIAKAEQDLRALIVSMEAQPERETALNMLVDDLRDDAAVCSVYPVDRDGVTYVVQVSTADYYNADHPAQPASEPKAEPIPIELIGLEGALQEGGGMWATCSGCYESNEGAPPNGAVFSKFFKCYLGDGCSECGGLGAAWDTTDYEAMADDMWKSLSQPKAEPVVKDSLKAEPLAYVKETEIRNGHGRSVLSVLLPVGTEVYAAPQARNPLTWQPIETAPKSKEVLVWREDSGPFVAKFATPEEVLMAHEFEEMDFPEDFQEWFSDAYGWQEEDQKPTHWMPLPDAPDHGIEGGAA